MIKLLLLFLVLAALLTGCNLETASSAQALQPTPTTPLPVGTAIPTLARAIANIENREPTYTPAVTATPASVVNQCDTEPETPTTQHVIDVTINYGEHTVEVAQRITYINRTSAPLNDLVLNVEPNRTPNVFTLNKVSIENREPINTLSGRRLFIELPETLHPDCFTEITLLFDLAVPAVRTGAEAYRGFFGYSPRQMNLGHWLPTVAVRGSDEWITRQTINVGEQEVIDKADWDVTVKVVNANANMKVAAPGDMTKVGDLEWRFIHPNSRDFTLSASENFTVSTAQSEDGVNLELYTFEDANYTGADGFPVRAQDHALDVTLRSFETFSRRFGVYDHQRLLVVQGDFPDGMEFSSIVFVGTDYFTSYEGRDASYLTLITAHEVAHQWWYARVGNDPALAPWLDEALSTYSEYIFLEEHYPALMEWWWGFRVEEYAPQGFVDSTIYDFTSVREYINAVYLRGVKMLHALRQDLGDPEFFRLLQLYLEKGDGQIVNSDFFWSLLTPDQLARTQTTRQQYLKQP